MTIYFCRDCKYSMPDKQSPWTLVCSNPKVNAKEGWILAHPDHHGGVACYVVRNKNSLFAPCNVRGKLWEPKDNVKSTSPY
jgi:hypothetical protein